MSCDFKVVKFGGSCLTSFSDISSCVDIVKNDVNIRLVVVSALGGTTKLLLSLIDPNLKSNELHFNIKKIEQTHNQILNLLEIDSCTSKIIENYFLSIKKLAFKLRKNFHLKLLDELLSFGEYLSSQIFVAVLKKFNIPAVLFDVKKALITNSNFGQAYPDLIKIKSKVRKILLPLCENGIVVTQGFIGANENGETTTLGFEGSDYSATLLAEALDCQEVGIWTDVPGICTIDPKIDQKAKLIEQLSAEAALAFATYGAKILHPAAIQPALRSNFKVSVSSPHTPQQKTSINRTKTITNIIYGVALREKQTLIKIKCERLFHSYQLLADLFDLLAEYKLGIDLINTSEASIVFVIDESNISVEKQSLLKPDLMKKLDKLGQIEIKSNLSLVSLIGNHLQSETSKAQNIFNILKDYHIHLLNYGASGYSINVLLSKNRAKELLIQLHDEFL